LVRRNRKCACREEDLFLHAGLIGDQQFRLVVLLFYKR
jgi:hypothetical protein